MIIVLKPRISKRDERAVLNEIRKLGYTPHVMRGVARTVIGAIGDELTHANPNATAQFPPSRASCPSRSAAFPSPRGAPFKFYSARAEHAIGGKKITGWRTGPVESEKQLLRSRKGRRWRDVCAAVRLAAHLSV
jgi:hypothetical protein